MLCNVSSLPNVISNFFTVDQFKTLSWLNTLNQSYIWSSTVLELGNELQHSIIKDHLI